MLYLEMDAANRKYFIIICHTGRRYCYFNKLSMFIIYLRNNNSDNLSTIVILGSCSIKRLTFCIGSQRFILITYPIRKNINMVQIQNSSFRA